MVWPEDQGEGLGCEVRSLGNRDKVHRSVLSDNDSAIFDISEHVKHDPAIDTNAKKNELLFFFVCCYFLLLE